jgi:hypothetical protein
MESKKIEIINLLRTRLNPEIIASPAAGAAPIQPNKMEVNNKFTIFYYYVFNSRRRRGE